MAMGRGDIRTRISLDGGDDVKRQLEQIGQSGERALRDLDRGAAMAGGGFARLGRDVDQSTRGFGVVRARFDGLRGSMAAAIGAFTSFRAGLAGLAGVGAIAAITGAVGNVTRSLTELRNVGAATGFDPEDVKALQEALEATGANAESVSRLLIRFSDGLGEARLKSQGMTQALQSGVAVMKGAEGAASNAAKGITVMRGAAADGANAADSLVKVFRGGEAAAAVKDLSDPFKALGINIRQFGTDSAGNRDALLAFIRGLAELRKRDAALATAVGAQQFGRQYIQLGEVVERLAENGAFEKIKQEVRDSGRAPDPKAFARLKEYEAAWDSLGDAIESAIQPAVIEVFPALTAGVQSTTAAVEKAVAGIKLLGAEVKAAFPGVAKLVGGVAGDTLGAVTPAGLASRLFNSEALRQAASSVVAGVRDAVTSATIGGFGGAGRPERQPGADTLDILSARDRQMPDGAAMGGVGTSSSFFGATGISAAMAPALAALDAAQLKFTTWVAENATAAQEAAVAALNSISELVERLVERGMEYVSGRIDALSEWADTTLAKIGALADDMLARISAGISAGFDAIQSAAADALNWIERKIDSVTDAARRLLDLVRSAMSAAGGALSGILPGFAEGGAVRGPGTATSDSVVARLSDGEYVMRARAVQFWGPQFMAAINSLRNPTQGFSLGGLVDRLSTPIVPSMPRFADGGLVMASAGASTAGGGRSAFTLVVGGQPHRVETDKATAERLVREARRERMLQTGVMPSWY